MPRPRPSLPLLNIPQDHFVEQWLDRFDASPIDDQVEYSLNLGAESPMSSEDDAMPSLPPQRKFTRRPRPAPRKKEAVDRDCGICFEYAVQPARTLCCGNFFCTEHITDWLSGPSSDGRCPSCSAPCSSTNILSLTSSTPSIKPAVSQDLYPTITITPPNSVNPSPRHRSQSESTNNTSVSSSGSEQSSMTTTSTSSISPSTFLPEGLRENHVDQPWFTSVLSLADMYYPRSVSPSLSHSQEGRERVSPRSSTFEALSRLVSVLGLTVLFYALLASS
ncbi:hypothetical protein AGABI2DRAFT_120099 [Agaricus bisporus var. bisporus H97]|uniref:hypothetical protein n=1 Tax=Agaricus bisporus var. bisporus (strain H97 / ATCC MYA-4626 / FGSC 10389) TaxID=936046 RepID=UPI00029F6F4A|nr:hypothetical protein AGABI2DRAFT_120099 [Agaricus bisporus var. bisporus H97]EKV45134.1 hypothetical protein AGABI2DRAFT_120099 [Agaricus bisporus var. bisporus H97]